jgi:hypothetical protein
MIPLTENLQVGVLSIVIERNNEEGKSISLKYRILEAVPYWVVR